MKLGFASLTMQNAGPVTGLASRGAKALLGAIAVLAIGACSTAGTGSGGSTNLAEATFGSETSTTATPAALSQAKANSSISAKVALLVPLSAEGQTAAIAKGLKQAGELALFEYESPGLQLIVKDTGGTADGARKAASDAVAAGAEIIIGPLFSKSVGPVREVARPSGIPIIALSNNTNVAGNGVYLLSFQAHQEVGRIVSYSASQGRTRFAGLIPDDAYGKVVGEVFRSTVARNAGTLVAYETYPPGANGMLEKAQTLFETVSGEDGIEPTADAVFVPGDKLTLPVLGPLIKHTKLDTSRVKLLGNGGWDYSGVTRETSFRNGWYAAPDPRAWSDFSQKFARTFGSAPPRIATLAFDGVGIATALARQLPRGQRYTAQTLTKPSGFAGVDGPVRFLSSGLAERLLAVLEVREFGPVVIDPAPDRFGISTASRYSAGARLQ